MSPSHTTLSRNKYIDPVNLDNTSTDTPAKQKWKNLRNRIKIKKLTPHHSGNDLIVKHDQPQILTGRFSYGGKFNFILTGESVEIFLSEEKNNQYGEAVADNWQYVTSEITDSNGRIEYEFPKESSMPSGIYKIKMSVKYDKSFFELFMIVLPAESDEQQHEATEAVLFNIDGLSSSVSTPKSEFNEIVNFWQNLGYLIVYVTNNKSDKIHKKIHASLANSSLPSGMVMSKGYMSWVKNNKSSKQEKSLVLGVNGLKVHAAYGTDKDLELFSKLGVENDKTFMLKGKDKKTSEAVFLNKDLMSHLNQLKKHLSKQAPNSTIKFGDLKRSYSNTFHSVTDS